MAQALSRTLTGEIELHSYDLESLDVCTVLVKLLAAPINPLDLLVLAGSYPVKPIYKNEERGIPGYDGIAEVLECGEGVTAFSPGDLVIPSKFGVGTWRTHAVLEVCDLQKVAQPKEIVFGAILKISVLPAYLLLEDMAQLKPGDWIIQNAATSVVAQMVAQLARLRGLHTISIIRDRDPIEVTRIKQLLKNAGAEIVFTERELPDHVQSVKAKPVMLALDSVFGSSARLLLDCLDVGGTFVQLGFLSGTSQELHLSSQDLFARRLTLRGFRSSAQIAERSVQEQASLLNWLVQLFNAGSLALPSLGLERVEWNGVKDVSENRERVLGAIDKAKRGALGQRKQIFMFT